jgi:hypothetical protein
MLATIIKLLRFQLKSSTHTHTDTQQLHSISTLVSFALLINRQALFTYMHTNNHQDSPVSNIVISTHTHADTQQNHLISTWTSFITLTNRQSSKIPISALGPSTNVWMSLKVQKVHQPIDKKDPSFSLFKLPFFFFQGLSNIFIWKTRIYPI